MPGLANCQLTLTMSAPAYHSVQSVATQLQQCIVAGLPFSKSAAGDLFLIAPLPDILSDRQKDALDRLVNLGVLSAYRYIDAKPQPAILAVRA